MGGSPSVTAALVAALAGGAGVIVAPRRDEVPAADEPAPLCLSDALTFPAFRDVRLAPVGFGPPRRGKKGKVVRW